MKRVTKPKVGMKVFGQSSGGGKYTGEIKDIKTDEIILDMKFVCTRSTNRIWHCYKKSDGCYGSDCSNGILYEDTFKSKVMEER